MAFRIVRKHNQIALIGAPTSAAARATGQERAPAALRAAGLAERLRAAGYDVTDLGDIPTQVYRPDEESPRARNLGAVFAALEALRPRVEQAFKAGALPLVLGGDCTVALATLAGIRRYLPSLGLLYFDRDADLNTPKTTPSGCLEGMGVAHIIGRGAPELVRFWSEPPLVREPDVAFFGLERLDPGERELLDRSPMRHYMVAEIRSRGAAAAAQAALIGLRAAAREFVLHVDVDVISSDDFAAVDLPGPGGLRFEEVRQALEACACQKNVVALEITAYNPELDQDGRGAQLLVDLLASVLAARLAALAPPCAVAAGSPAREEPTGMAEPPAVTGGVAEPAVPEGEALADSRAEPPAPYSGPASSESVRAEPAAGESVPGEPVSSESRDPGVAGLQGRPGQDETIAGAGTEASPLGPPDGRAGRPAEKHDAAGGTETDALEAPEAEEDPNQDERS